MRGYCFCQSREPPKALENDARRSPKATRKREQTLQKRIRNSAEKSCLGKPKNVAKRAPGGTLEAPKNRLKTDPKLHPSPRGPTIWPKVPRGSHFTPQTSHFIAFGYHFASFLERICDPKAANQASAEAENLSSILHISSRVRGLYLFFKGRRQCFAHQYILF